MNKKNNFKLLKFLDHNCKLPPDSGYACADGTTVNPNVVYYFANMSSGYCEEVNFLNSLKSAV